MEERREVGGEGGFARVDSVAKDSPAENAVSPSLSLSLLALSCGELIV